MKTFAETQGEKPFNWEVFLSKPKISDREWVQAKERARKWTTCACGNLCSIIPRWTPEDPDPRDEGDVDVQRERNGVPKDKILRVLGGADGFYGAIMENNAVVALEWLKMIEIRSTELIKKELSTIPVKIRDLYRAKDLACDDFDHQIKELEDIQKKYL